MSQHEFLKADTLRAMELCIQNAPCLFSKDKQLFLELIRQFRDQRDILIRQRAMLKRMKPTWTQEDLDAVHEKAARMYELICK